MGSYGVGVTATVCAGRASSVVGALAVGMVAILIKLFSRCVIRDLTKMNVGFPIYRFSETAILHLLLRTRKAA